MNIGHCSFEMAKGLHGIVTPASHGTVNVLTLHGPHQYVKSLPVQLLWLMLAKILHTFGVYALTFMIPI